MQAVGDTGEAVDNIGLPAIQHPKQIPGDSKPVTRGVHVLFGEGYVAVAEIFRRIKFDLLVAHHLAHHLHFPVLPDNAAICIAFETVDNPDIGVGHGVGEIVHIDLSHVGLLPLQVQLVHVILLRFDHIYGVVMNGGKGAVPIHLGDNVVRPRICRIDDDHIFGIDAAEAHLVGGIALGGPVPAVFHAMQDALFLQIGHEFFQVLLAETFPLFKGKFEGGAF